MELVIQTSVPNTIRIALGEGGTLVTQKTEAINFHNSEKLLGFVQKLLSGQQKTWSDITGVIVALGPQGSFTALRVGVVVTNTVAWSLDIPNVGVEGKDFELNSLYQRGRSLLEHTRKPQILEPHYEKPPNITKPKEERRA